MGICEAVIAGNHSAVLAHLPTLCQASTYTHSLLRCHIRKITERIRCMDLVTVYEAAKRLGISEGAVRQRIHRGSLESDKDKDGRVYVYLSEDTAVNTANIQDENSLLDELRDRIRFLEEELSAWKEQAQRNDEEARRKDTLLAQMNQTLS